MAKLQRADAHLILLYEKVGPYLHASPYALAVTCDVGNGEPGIVFHVRQQPPLEFSAIAGDIVHNIRSALDYIAHELIQANGFSTIKRTQFPICASARDFDNEAINQGRLNGISLRGYQTIDAVQPHQVEASKLPDHPLWQLQYLSNRDKHQALALTAIGASVNVRFTHPNGNQVSSGYVGGPLKDGTIVARMPVEFFHPQIKTEGRISCQVTFPEGPVRAYEAINALQRIREFVGVIIIPAVERLLGPLPDSLKFAYHGLPPAVMALVRYLKLTNSRLRRGRTHLRQDNRKRNAGRRRASADRHSNGFRSGLFLHDLYVERRWRHGDNSIEQP